MKLFVLILLFFVFTTSLLCKDGNGGVLISPAFASESETGRIVGVDQLMKNVDEFRGSIRVEGVVSAVSRTDHTLSLIDKQEFKKCGIVTCASLTLPVRWAGSMPSVKDEVLVQGEVKQNRGKLIFEARELEATASQRVNPK